jgi:hypothetical protein
MDYNFFLKTSAALSAGKRLAEHIDLCERALNKARFPRYTFLCRHTLAGCYREGGDAGSARDTLEYLIEQMEDEPQQREMENIYVESCRQMARLADSYGEYETYMGKISAIRPFTPEQKEEMRLVESLKNSGKDWACCMETFLQKCREEKNHAEAAMLSSLLLDCHKTLGLSSGKIVQTLREYVSHIGCLIAEYRSYCEREQYPFNPYNYLFIVEIARIGVGVFQKLPPARQEADRAMEKLAQLQDDLEGTQRRNAQIGYDYTAPGYVSPRQLEEEIRRNELEEIVPSGFEPATKEEQRKKTVRFVVHLFISGALANLGMTVEQTWLKVLLFIPAFYEAFAAILTFRRRKFRRRSS